MDKKKFQRIGVSIFIISLLITPVNSLDTGDLKPGFNEVNLSFNISIKLWGYDELSSNLSRELSELLPNSIITESQFPPEGKIDQYVILANQAWFGIKNKISYNIEPINIDNEIDYLTSRISYFDNSNEKGGITGFYYDKGILKNQTGYVIDSKSMGEVLKNFNTPTGYTLRSEEHTSELQSH